MKKTLYLAAIVLATSLSACTDDLDQMPNTSTTSSQVYTTAANYKAVLGKLYASFVIAGQEKDGNKDLSSNLGFDYMRYYFNLQECGTDEVASTWLEGDKLRDVTFLNWDANDPWVSDMYYRAYYTIALANELIRNATDSKISGFSDAEQASLRTYRTEARFLRALAYYHVLDLYRNAPFVTENDPVGAFIPPRYTAEKLFQYIESELLAINESLPARQTVEYGHAPQAAAWTLLSRLYLNHKVYLEKEDAAYYTQCITWCNKVIAAGYTIEGDYAKLFNADNHLRTNEIIFPLVVDATLTSSWGASTSIICGASNADSKTLLGVSSEWNSFRTRGELTNKFDDDDRRGMFYTQGQTQFIEAMDNQVHGYLSLKWTNLNDAGEAVSNTAKDGVSTDYPMFRLADVYLMLAEAHVRGGAGTSLDIATGYVNQLRERAYGDNYATKGQITKSALTLPFLIDERARELYWEGVRRTDLIRFGMFTTADYIWQWKGGIKEGKAVDKKYNIYPIPATELSANPNLKNENY
ncbi:putative outer membrane starch-binding protein [Breznakibacter xylanolyticus]|uniref:Putative outer membrane starch-binding protein n=1 Tax=Breznakibacter xylanolyticus TaxID=990 RepID=A0A2W7PAT5_9BACT|nr:RagB/SusD family nutrient uptake outer membrane protein [Breznakibacter xylanolyticus]PZX20422.1 putative outer membrane starch-binding protein [Breznakibacter xylanolyticus]